MAFERGYREDRILEGRRYNQLWLGDCTQRLNSRYIEKYVLDWGYANKHLRSRGVNSTGLESFIYAQIGGGRISYGDSLPRDCTFADKLNFRCYQHYHAAMNISVTYGNQGYLRYIGLAYNTNYELRNQYYCMAPLDNHLITPGDYWGVNGQPLPAQGLQVIHFKDCQTKNKGTQYWQWGTIAMPPAPHPESAGKLMSAYNDVKCITYNVNVRKFVMANCRSDTDIRQLFRVDDNYFKLKSVSIVDENNDYTSCLKSKGSHQRVTTEHCNNSKSFSREWYTSPSTEGDYFKIRNRVDGKCLTVKVGRRVTYIEVRDCEDDNQNQQWEWK